YALWKARPAPLRLAASLVVWLVASWLVVSTSAARDRVLEVLVRADTLYSSGYSERAFADLTLGASAGDVDRALGVPHAEIEGFGEATRQRRCRWIRFEEDRAAAFVDARECVAKGILVGTSRRDVLSRLGPPDGGCR